MDRSRRLVIAGGTVVTMADGRPVERADVLVEDGRIARVGGEVAREGAQVITADGCAVLPGLVNTHTHLFQVLLRGFVDGVSLAGWLREIYRVGTVLTPDDCRVSARLGALESLRGGVTTVLEHHFVHPSLDHPAATIEGLAASGIRAVVARTSMDTGDLVPPGTVETPAAAAAAAERFLERFAARPRLSLMVGPNTPPINASADLVRTMHGVARRHGVRVSAHCAEGAAIAAAARALGAEGVVGLFDGLGVLDAEWVLAHCVHLTDEEIEILRARGAAVAHNPVSNMFLGDGIAPLVKMRRAGIPVGLGTDGPSSNNTLDMFETMKVTSLLQRVAALDAGAIRPAEVLEMATLGGARACGLDHLVGSIEVGKRADLIVIDLGRPHLVVLHDIYSQLVHCARASDVRDTIVDGRVLMRDRVVQTLDEAAVVTEAREAGARLAAALRASARPRL
jgi:5-methylthioadenosine/S-adenosylhomocysteine deaminase